MIFSDLDGTFLEHSSYSCGRSLPALRRVLDSGDSVVFCSSKTAAEIRKLLSGIGLRLPFIAENGGAILLPRRPADGSAIQRGSWYMIPLGMPHNQVLRAIDEIREEVPVRIRGFADMSAREIADACGLPLAHARRARLRDFDEPITLEPATSENVQSLTKALRRRGLTLTRGGRFFHVLGLIDKGSAIERMASLIRTRHESFWSIGIGDSANDLPMLRQVDLPLVVQKPEGVYDPDVVREFGNLLRVPLPGPEGWAAAMTRLLAPGADSPSRAAALLRREFKL